MKRIRFDAYGGCLHKKLRNALWSKVFFYMCDSKKLQSKFGNTINSDSPGKVCDEKLPEVSVGKRIWDG